MSGGESIQRLRVLGNSEKPGLGGSLSEMESVYTGPQIATHGAPTKQVAFFAVWLVYQGLQDRRRQPGNLVKP